MNKAQRSVGFGIVLWTLLFCADVTFATIRYVKPGGTGTGTSTWNNASGSVQAMIDASSAGTNDEVWVAQGTYKPGTLATHSFSLKNGIRVRGGFFGTTGTEGDVNARDPDPLTNNTVLSGDLGGGVHSQTVVKALSIIATATTILNSFTITEGNGGQGGYGAGVYIASSSSPTIQFCRIISNRIPGTTDGFGAGVYVGAESQANILDCVIEQNISKFGGGLFIDYYSTAVNPVITRCTFVRNVALRKGGGLHNTSIRNPRILDCIFYANEAQADGDGSSGDDIYKGGGGVTNEIGTMTLVNCLFAGNRTGRNGGGFNNEPGSTATLINCTFHDNRAVWQGGGIAIRSATTTIKNCVAWGNSDPGGTDESAQIDVTSASPTVTHSCIQDSDPNDASIPFGGASNNNIDDDPMFVQSSTLNLRLKNTSPCLNNGDNSALTGVTSDLDGRNRIIPTAGTVDRGAYEYDTVTNCDGIGGADDGQISADPTKDCNNNRTLDVCEIVPIGTGPDCNSNGVIDACEIAGGSFDCQGDGIPDECQFTADCDLNCVEDSTEITGNDCDSTGVLDACEAVLPRIWTTDADFDEGTSINVNHGTANQLRRNSIATTNPLPYIWVAASARNTFIRIKTETGEIVGEYHSAPQQHIINGFQNDSSGSPSRTTVDLDGSMWAANRADGPTQGSVVKIGLTIGGTRANADGSANASGDYLKGPFDYCTCEDRDGDGLIKTSRGLADIRPWDNWDGEDDDGGVANAEDECILRYVRSEGTGTRTVAIDKDNDVWVGCFDAPRWHEQIDGFTGEVITAPSQKSCGGYGGLVDCAGRLWSSNRDLGLLRIPSTTVCDASRGNYGLGFDPRTGNIWHSSFGNPPYLVYEIDATTETGSLHSYTQGFNGSSNSAKGLAVDSNGHVWVAESDGNEVMHLAPHPTISGQHIVVGYISGFNGASGTAVDGDGFVWVTERFANKVSRINPQLGSTGGGGYPIGAIETTPFGPVSLGTGADPYNYSDMTGMVGLHTSASGTWTVVHDGGVNDAAWGRVLWNTESCASQPSGTSLSVTIRAANSEGALPLVAYTGVTHGTCLTGIAGRYVQVRVRFRGVCPPNSDTPVLCDLRVVPASICLKADVDLNGIKNGRDIQDFLDQFFPARACPTQLCPADLDGDGEVDLEDIPLFATCLVTGAANCGINNCGPGGVISYPDCNTNGISDVIDIGFGTSLDCNTNGVPDDCDIDESDPDGNELVSADVNTNTIPDECEPDCNNNDTPDAWDITMVTSSDVNTNGVPDECEPDCDSDGLPDSYEVAQGAADCNTNGTPDACEQDCNTNGVPDDCDIDPTDPDGDEWVSPDCNSNSYPDECDLAIPPGIGGSLDCNTNGIPDECNIAACESDPACDDCNENGIPDSCDIAAEISEDANTNGIPDECEGEGMMGGWGGGGESMMSDGGEGGEESEGDQSVAWDAFYEWSDQQCWGPACETTGAEQFAAMVAKLRELGLPVKGQPVGP